jgi:hypothetical protein
MLIDPVLRLTFAGERAGYRLCLETNPAALNLRSGQFCFSRIMELHLDESFVREYLRMHSGSSDNSNCHYSPEAVS